MSNYIEHFLKSSQELPKTITQSLFAIEELDKSVEGISYYAPLFNKLFSYYTIM
jgi:hypothetical protein